MWDTTEISTNLVFRIIRADFCLAPVIQVRAKPTIDYTSNALNRILVFQFYFNIWKGVFKFLKHLHFFDFLFSLITCMATESRLIRNAIFIFIIPILIENQNTNNRASSRWQITHFLNLLPYLSIYKIHQISEKFGLVTFEKYSSQLCFHCTLYYWNASPNED